MNFTHGIRIREIIWGESIKELVFVHVQPGVGPFQLYNIKQLQKSLKMMSCFWIFVLITRILAQDTKPELLNNKKLTAVYEWKSIDYTWTSPEQKQEAIQNGDYDVQVPIPIDIEKSKDGRVFVTMNRLTGVPASITTISQENGTSGPLLSPYPNWSWHTKGDCDKITNARGITVDDCNRLWVVDSGISDSKVLCEAQLLVFDLNSDQLIRKIKIPRDIAANKSGIGSLDIIVVDTEGQCCEKTTAYVTDVTGFGLIVWNGNKVFRLETPLFQANESHVEYSVAGDKVTLDFGISGLALTPVLFPGESRMLMFRPMSSLASYFVPTSALARGTDAKRMRIYGASDILTSQAVSQAVSSQGTLFYGMATELSIGCWNRYKIMEKENFNVAVSDPVQLQHMRAMKIYPESITKGAEELWVMTNRYQLFSNKKMDFNETNFRILKIKVSDLIVGTQCELPIQIKNDFKVINDRTPPLLAVCPPTINME